MNRLMLVLAVLAVALLLPVAAAAKGPSAASISGDTLTKVITISGDGETDQTPLGRLTMEAGFFPAAFGQSPNPMLPKRPGGPLGPRLMVHYTVPGGDSKTFYVNQDVYPYAKGGALTYMKPGQPIFGMATIGGWYRAYGLKRTLVAQGVPAKVPSARSSKSNLALLAGIGIPGALALAGAGIFFRRRKS
jgi:LPXTG-motif cell wall-anchored protein